MTITIRRIPEYFRKLLVTLACIHCGTSSEELVYAVAALGPLPRQCSHCGGPVLANSISVRKLRNPNFPVDLDWPPRRKPGRPKKLQAHA